MQKQLHQKVRYVMVIWVINIEEWYELNYFTVQTRFWMQLLKAPPPPLSGAFIVYGTSIKHSNVRQSLADLTETLYRNSGICMIDIYRGEN